MNVALALQHLSADLGLVLRVKGAADLEATYRRAEVVQLVELVLDLGLVLGLEELVLRLQLVVLQEVRVVLANAADQVRVLRVLDRQVLKQKVQLVRQVRRELVEVEDLLVVQDVLGRQEGHTGKVLAT